MDFKGLESVGTPHCSGTVCIPSAFIFRTPEGASYTFYEYIPPAGFGPYLTPANYSKVVTGQGLGPGRIIAVYNAANQITVNIGYKSYTFNRLAANQSFEISKISDAGGVAYTYTRDANRNITAITNALGAAVQFTWGGNSRVSTIKAPDNSVWTYSYNANGMLSQVTPPQPSSGVYTYFYEDAGNSSRVTGYAIDGVRMSKYTYDGNGRVIRSESMDGEVVDKFVYGTNTTTLTDVRNQVTQYTFNTKGQLTATQTTGTPSCPSAAASQAYDSNGFLSESTDFNGNRTTYSFNIDGMLLSQTVAAGTASALTTTYNYGATGTATLDLLSIVSTGANGVNVSSVEYTYVNSILGRLPATILVKDLLTGAMQRQTAWSYTFRGNGGIQSKVFSVTLPSGTATTTYSYDSSGNLSAETNPVGHVTTYANYNGLGLPGQVTDTKWCRH